MEATYLNSKGKFAITKYQSCEFIVVDDDPLGDPNDEHVRKNNAMKNFFHHHTNCVATSLHLPRHNTVESWNEFWSEKIGEGKDGNVMIIYFEGLGSGNGRNYRWYLQNNPRYPVDIYDLVERINETNIDCLLILYCWLPTRFHERWKRKTETHGNTEIFSRGEIMPRAPGRPADLSGDFTMAIIRNMETYLERAMMGRFKAPRSIPEIMKVGGTMHSNPRRVWFNRPKAPHKELIRRVKILPWAIRESGIFEFNAVQVQPLLERYQGYWPLDHNLDASEPEKEDEEEVNDEGFQEGEEAGSESSVQGQLFVPGGGPWDSNWEDDNN